GMGRKEGFNITAGLEAENGTAIIEEIEFDVAAAADQLFLAVRLCPWQCEIFANQPRIDSQECTTNVLCERKCLIPIRFEIVIKYAANTARFISVFEKKIVVAPFSVFVVGSDFRVQIAGCFHGSMKGNAVGIRLQAAPVQHRCEVGTATEPGFARNDEACVHVNSRHIRIMKMRDQGDSGSPETRVFFGAWNVVTELRREFSVHR